MSLTPYEPHEPAALEPGAALVSWAGALQSAHTIATALCRTSFVPAHFKGKPEEAAAALLLGDELGLSPVSALRSIFVIGGTPGMYARTMVALVQSRGHEVWTEKETPEKVIVCGRRAGSDQVERSEWTLDRARRAGYTNNKKYESDPMAMLYARAASTVCRRIAADVLAGIPYSAEELEDETGEAAAPAKATRVRRKPEPAPVAPEPDLEAMAPPVVESVTVVPEPMTDATRGQMFALFAEKKITEREQQLAGINATLGTSYTSRSELSEADARAVIAALRKMGGGE